MNLGQLAGQRAQYRRRAVGRAMIGKWNSSQKARSIAHRRFDKEVLVADKEDSDNARLRSIGLLTLDENPKPLLFAFDADHRAKACSRRKTTSSVRSQEMASNGPPPSSMLIPMS